MKAVTTFAGLLLLTTLTLAPLAAAADPIPECIQGPCLPPIPVECIQARPWSDLCNGDVVGFACYVADCTGIILP